MEPGSPGEGVAGWQTSGEAARTETAANTVPAEPVLWQRRLPWNLDHLERAWPAGKQAGKLPELKLLQILCLLSLCCGSVDCHGTWITWRGRGRLANKRGS